MTTEIPNPESGLVEIKTGTLFFLRYWFANITGLKLIDGFQYAKIRELRESASKQKIYLDFAPPEYLSFRAFSTLAVMLYSSLPTKTSEPFKIKSYLCFLLYSFR